MSDEQYSKVSRRMWLDSKFNSWSKPQPNAQTLWQYILTGAACDKIPGLLRAGVLTLADDLDWSPEDTRRCLREIEDAGAAVVDHKARLIWLPNAIKHNMPANTSVVQGWATAWRRLPECELRDRAAAALVQRLQAEDDRRRAQKRAAGLTATFQAILDAKANESGDLDTTVSNVTHGGGSGGGAPCTPPSPPGWGDTVSNNIEHGVNTNPPNPPDGGHGTTDAPIQEHEVGQRKARRGRDPSAKLASTRYAEAYAFGMTDVTGEPFTPPLDSRAKSVFAHALQTHARDPATKQAITGQQLCDWIRQSAADYRRSIKQANVGFQSGFAPHRWQAWLDSGKPGYVPQQEVSSLSISERMAKARAATVEGYE